MFELELDLYRKLNRRNLELDLHFELHLAHWYEYHVMFEPELDLHRKLNHRNLELDLHCELHLAHWIAFCEFEDLQEKTEMTSEYQQWKIELDIWMG